MKSLSTFLFAFATFVLTAADRHNWEQSIVYIDVKRKQYDYTQPWSIPMQNLQKFGVVIKGNQVLTTADGLSDRTLLRLQKEGRGKWFVGEVNWIDYHANIALVTTEEKDFWQDLLPVELPNPISVEGPMQIMRWKSGKLERRQAEFNQFVVEEGKMTYIPFLHLEVTSEINAAGWSEPLICNGKFIGLLASQNGNSCKIIPASFHKDVLDARAAGKFKGLGYFNFVWQPGENPTTLNYLRSPNENGVIVIEIPNNEPTPFKKHDLILEVDGFPVDITGEYKDPHYGYLSLENLATRKKWAGEPVKFKIVRDGKPMDLTYKIKKADFDSNLVVEADYDEAPEYMIVGGLVFQPLSNSYLRSWGGDWRRRAPFRLTYYNNTEPTKDRPSMVFLSQVLPDPYNIGYQEQRYLVVDKVNGQTVASLGQLKNAIDQHKGEFHVFEFMKGETLQKIVLDAAEADSATKRILSRYGIEKDHHIIPPASVPPIRASVVK